MSSRKIYIMAVAAIVLIAIGCTKTSTGPASTPYTDDQQVSDMATVDDSSYFSTSGDVIENEMNTGNPSMPAESDSLVLTRWGRINMRVVSRTVTTQIDSASDSANVTFTWTIAGTMRLITATDSIDKPYHDVYTQKAIYRRIGRTRFRAMNWRLIRVSAVAARTQGATEPIIGTVSWFRKPSGASAWTQVGSVSYPVNTWLYRDSLPEFHPGDSVKVHVTVSGTGTYYGQLHYRARGMEVFGRTPMMQQSDLSWDCIRYVPNDAMTISRGLYVDFMTDGTIHDATAAYDANIWGLIYRVAQ